MSANRETAAVTPLSIVEPAVATPSPAATQPPWPLATRIAFRFACAFWLLFLFPWPVSDWIPPLGRLWGVWMDKLMPWIGHHLLRIQRDLPIEQTGSGDRTVDWINYGVYLALAIVAAVVWSIADRRRTRYDRLHEVVRILVRYCLALTMFGYGIIKLFKGQFHALAPFRYIETYGETSPMGLLWTFMGHSPAYVIFAGAGETLGAALLCFRRTTTLGALVVVAVMTNVVMLNLCYDVPVKLGSSTYLLMALFLLAPDARRLANLFVLNRPTQPAAQELVLPRRWMRIGRVVAKVAILGFALFSTIKMARQNGKFSFEPKTFMDGIWDIKGLVKNGAVVPLPLTDDKSWRRVVFVLDGMNVRTMTNERVVTYNKSEDEAKHQLTLTPLDEKQKPKKGPSYVLVETRVDHDHVTLAGKLAGDDVELQLQRVDPAKSLLRTRGFHWITEEPFNR